jgi:autotransporter strand-loop-strand O-heptosyltransferase
MRFDFNDGRRVALPEGKWHVRLRDLDSGNILYDETHIYAGHINTTKRYYLRCRIEVWMEESTSEPIFRHDYSAEDRDVLVEFS